MKPIHPEGAWPHYREVFGPMIKCIRSRTCVAIKIDHANRNACLAPYT